MALSVNKGTWGSVTKFMVNTSDKGWQNVVRGLVKTVIGWVQFYPAAGPWIASQLKIATSTTQYPSSGTNYPVLTGTNYNWSSGGGLVLTYSFKKSSSASGPFTLVTGSGKSGSISNPSISNTATYTVVPADLTGSNPTYFVFEVSGTDNSGTTAESSYSNPDTSVNVIAIYGPSVTIANGTWSAGPYYSSSNATYTVGAVTNASYTKTYITRSDGLVVLNDTTFNSKVKYLGSTPTDNQGGYYQINFDNTDVGLTYSAYTIAYDVSNNGKTSGTTTMSTTVQQGLALSTPPTTTQYGTYLGIGYTVRGNTGTYSTTPDGVFWTWQYSPDNVLANFKTMYNSSGSPLSSGTDYSSQNQNHDFTIPVAAYIYNSSNVLVYTPIVNGYIKFYANAYQGATYIAQATNVGIGPIVNPTPYAISPVTISSPTSVLHTTYGNFGSWGYANSNDTTYSYLWEYYNGSSYSQVVNAVGTASVTAKQVIGTTGILTTQYPGGYRSGGSLTVVSVDNLFNGNWPITGVYRDQIYIDLSGTPAYSYTTAYTAYSSYVSYQGSLYQSTLNIPSSTAYNNGSYAAGSSVTYNGYRYYATQYVAAYISQVPSTAIYLPSGNQNSTSYWRFVTPTDTYFFTPVNVPLTSSGGTVAGTSYSEGINLPYPFYSSVPLLIPSSVTSPGTLRFTVTATSGITGLSGTSIATKSLYGIASATLGTVTNGNASASIPYTLTNGGELDISISPSGGVYTTVYTSSSGTISVSGLTNGTSYTLSATPYNADSYAGTTVTTTLSPVAPLRTVTFNGNGNTGGSTVSQTTNTPTALRANGFTRTNYTFSGWNTNSNGTGTAYLDQQTYDFSTDLTLYAQWTYVPPTYTVTFNANGGSGTMSSQSSSSAAALNLNQFTYTDRTFSGWNTAINGTGTSYSNGGTYPFTSSTTLYAQWTVNTPTTPTITNVSSTTSSITVKINFGSYTNGCYIYYSTTFTPTPVSSATYSGLITTNGGNYTVTGLASGTYYYIYAVPYNSAANGSAATGSGSTQATIPPVPTISIYGYGDSSNASTSGFNVSSSTATSISWNLYRTATGTATSSNGYNGYGTGTYTLVKSGTITGSSGNVFIYRDYALLNGYYYLTASATNSAGTSSISSRFPAALVRNWMFY